MTSGSSARAREAASKGREAFVLTTVHSTDQRVGIICLHEPWCEFEDAKNETAKNYVLEPESS